MALLLNKQKSPVAVVHLDENKKSKRIPEKLRTKAKKLIAKSDVKDCRKILADRGDDDLPNTMTTNATR